MTSSSSSKDRSNAGRDDCQIHVDKEGESCVIKIESIGQEKMLKELLGRFNSLKSEVNQLLSGQQKQDQPKEMLNAIQDITAKLKPLEDQLEKVNQNVDNDHIQLNKFQNDLNKKFDDIKQSIQNLQVSFDKEKVKPDILARKLDSIDQKLKESHPEHMSAIKDIQTKIEPLHKATPQTSETLMKINDRVKAMHADTTKSHPDIIQKLDSIDQQLKKQSVNDKINATTEGKLGSGKSLTQRKANHSNSPNNLPLCVNGMIPVLSKLSDPHVLQALAGDISKTLSDIQTKLPSSDDLKQKQDSLIENLTKQQTPLIDELKRLTPILNKVKDQQEKNSENLNRELEKTIQPITSKLNELNSKLNQLSLNIDKDKQTKPDVMNVISTRTQPIQQALENLSKEQQPLIEIIRDLPKKLDNIQQSQPKSDLIKEFSSKIDPLTQSIKQINENLNKQIQNKDQDIDKALQPFSHMIKTLKDSIEQSNADITKNFKQTDPTIKKLSDEISNIKTLVEKQTTPDEILTKINDMTQKHKAPLEAAIKDIHTQASKDSIDIKKTNDDLAQKIDKVIDPLKKLDEQIRHIANKIETVPSITTLNTSQKQTSDLMKTLKDVNDHLTHLNNNIEAMGDIPKQINSLKDLLDKFKSTENNKQPSYTKRFPNQVSSKSKDLNPKENEEGEDDEKTGTNNLRQVPLSQSSEQVQNNLMTTSDGQIANLFTNLLTLQTSMQNSNDVPYEDIQTYLKRIEQSPIVQKDRDLQKLLQRLKDLCFNKNNNTRNGSNRQQTSEPNQSSTKNYPNIQSSEPSTNSVRSNTNLQNPNFSNNPTRSNLNVQNPDDKKNASQSNMSVQSAEPNKNLTKTNSNTQNSDPNKTSTKNNLNIPNTDPHKSSTRSNSNIQSSEPDSKSTTSNLNIQGSQSNKNPSKTNSNMQNTDSSRNPSKSNLNVQNSEVDQNSTRSNMSIQNPDSVKNANKDNSNPQTSESDQNVAKSNTNVQNPDSYKNLNKGTSNIQNLEPNKNLNKDMSNTQNPEGSKNLNKGTSNTQTTGPNGKFSKNNLNVQNPDADKNSTRSNSNIENDKSDTNSSNRNDQSNDEYSDTNNSENRTNSNNKFSLPEGYLTKSRYISLLSDKTIHDNWPKLSSRSTPIVESILNQPLEFDKGTNLDRLIKQNGLEEYASLRDNVIKKSTKDYDKICYMMDSIVFDNMTMIGSREAVIRPWDPSLLNRASSKGSYPYPSGNGRNIERFKVDKDICLWMVETDESKPYKPTEFLPNIGRLNDKYERIQQPQYQEICQKRREDETRWNERYAFTRDNRTVLFVNDLRSYFMDYDTKRKYQVHDGVPINPVCRTGIAGRGDLPFWGPNHCVVVVLLRNINEPEVVLMKHHGDALVLPKGFYGHEARYDNQIKIIQDPVSGQILPPSLFNYWWSNIVKLNETNNSIKNLKRVLNDKELKEEFAEIFSQKGCNKSVFDNGYVDHPLNTDHAWVESSIWKIQFKDWRIPEMKSAKYSIAADDVKSNNKTCPFVWMKLTDAILIVPSFDRGILVDVLATGMPL